MRSQTSFNNKEISEELKDNEFQITKYQELKNKQINWKEPKIEDFAKEIDLKPLYSLGYDLGSSYIHPRADEGYWDALRIVKKENKPEVVTFSLLKNSVLMSYSVLALTTRNSKNYYGHFLQVYCDKVFKILNSTLQYESLKNNELMIYSELMPKE